MTNEIIKQEDKLVDVNSRTSLIEFANELKMFIVKQGLFSTIQNKNYVNVEGWEFAGMATGISPIVTLIERIGDNSPSAPEIKYRAEVELHDREGNKVGFGMAICSNMEYSKKKFDEYAIASMAQTRAIGKAYRNKFAFLMKMAGYETTPAEEAPVVVEEKVASKETIDDVVAGYKKMIHDAKTDHAKNMVLGKMKRGLESNIISQESFNELTKIMSLSNKPEPDVNQVSPIEEENAVQ